MEVDNSQTELKDDINKTSESTSLTLLKTSQPVFVVFDTHSKYMGEYGTSQSGAYMAVWDNAQV